MLIGTNSLLLQNKLEHFELKDSRREEWVLFFTVYVGKEQLRSVAEAFLHS